MSSWGIENTREVKDNIQTSETKLNKSHIGTKQQIYLGIIYKAQGHQNSFSFRFVKINTHTHTHRDTHKPKENFIYF